MMSEAVLTEVEKLALGIFWDDIILSRVSDFC